MQSPAAHAQLLRCGRPKTAVMLESESMTAARWSQKRTVGRTSRVSLVKHGTMARIQPFGRKTEKSQRFEPQTLCETADRLRILTTGGMRFSSLLEKF